MLKKPNKPIILKQTNAKKPRNIKNRVVFFIYVLFAHLRFANNLTDTKYDTVVVYISM